MGATLTADIAAQAARLVVEDGMEYAAAKHKAVRALGRHGLRSAELPGNEQLEDEIRAYIALYCPESQASELAALRQLALGWMDRLAEFRPYLTGAVWRGTATRWSAIHLDLYCDDAKAAEIGLINRGLAYDVGSRPDRRGGQHDVLSLASRCDALGETVTVYLTVLDHDDLRGALKPDGRGRSWRGDAAALRALLDREAQAS